MPTFTIPIIVAKNWILLSRYDPVTNVDNVNGFTWGQVAVAGSGTIYQAGIVLLFRSEAAMQITIDNVFYYLLYDNPPDVIIGYNPGLA
jgi:hypothetical protein